MQAVLRRLPRGAPANQKLTKPLPRRGRPPGAAKGRVPAQPARGRRALCLHLLYVPGRHGLRCCQCGRRRRHQRYEPARPRRQNANAAVVVSVDGATLTTTRPRLWRSSAGWSRRPTARAAGIPRPGGDGRQLLAGRGALELGAVQPTYPRGVTPYDLGSLLPGELSGALRDGLTALAASWPLTVPPTRC